MIVRLEYHGRMIQTNSDPDNPVVKVFARSCFLDPLHVTTSLDLAMRWIDTNKIEETK
jgi:hypothetical protein